MAFITTIEPDDARGKLRAEYEAAVERAGRLWNVVRLMSLNPEVLGATMGLYKQAIFGSSPLSRSQREMLAVVTSGINGCHY